MKIKYQRKTPIDVKLGELHVGSLFVTNYSLMIYMKTDTKVNINYIRCVSITTGHEIGLSTDTTVHPVSGYVYIEGIKAITADNTRALVTIDPDNDDAPEDVDEENHDN